MINYGDVCMYMYTYSIRIGPSTYLAPVLHPCCPAHLLQHFRKKDALISSCCFVFKHQRSMPFICISLIFTQELINNIQCGGVLMTLQMMIKHDTGPGWYLFGTRWRCLVSGLKHGSTGAFQPTICAHAMTSWHDSDYIYSNILWW